MTSAFDSATPEQRAFLKQAGFKKPRKPMKRTGFVTTKELTQPERLFQRQVEDAGQKLGWYMWHVRDAKQSKAGFPDIMAVRERVVWIELKVYYENGRANRTSGIQDRFHDMLRAAGQEVYVVFNDDDGWDTLKRVLR